MGLTLKMSLVEIAKYCGLLCLLYLSGGDGAHLQGGGFALSKSGMSEDQRRSGKVLDSVTASS